MTIQRKIHFKIHLKLAGTNFKRLRQKSARRSSHQISSRTQTHVKTANFLAGCHYNSWLSIFPSNRPLRRSKCRFQWGLRWKLSSISNPGKQMHIFERKRGAGNEHAGSKGILGREEIKMADARVFFTSFWDVFVDDEFWIGLAYCAS